MWKQAAKRAIRLASQPFGTITHVATKEPAVALTFDDGPNPEATPRLLDVLEHHGAKATFFMVGKVAARHPELVRRVSSAGHALGCHSWDHSSFPLITGSWRRTQLRWCQEVLAEPSPRLFRPPHGHQSIRSHLDAWWLGFSVVTWNLSAEDWKGEDAEQITDRLKPRLLPGSIVLLHDALYATSDERYRDREATIRATDSLLRDLGSTFRFVTVPELLRIGRPEKWPWYRRADLQI